MEPSTYLEQILFYNQSSATDQILEERSSEIFEEVEAQSFVKIHVQIQDSYNSSSLSFNQQKGPTHLDAEAASIPSSPVDHSDYFGRDPPRYVGSPGLHYRSVSNAQDLKNIALVRSKLNFIRQRHSHSRLCITRKLFEVLMSEFHIFPRFREFVLLFGSKRRENEIGPPRMRFRPLLTNRTELVNRQYTGFECAYGLRYVELNYRGVGKLWSLRQTAMYHKYKVDKKSSTWVIISPSSTAELSLDRYIKDSKVLAAASPFEIHLILLDAALANWRPYILYLTEQVMDQSERVLVASVDEKDVVQLLDFKERQLLKDIEDQIIDILLVLDSTSDTISSVAEMYKQFCQGSSKIYEDLNDDEFDLISFSLQEKQRDVVQNRKKIETLHAKIQGTATLLSSLLDLGNGSSIKQLAEEARKENYAIRQLTEKSTRDAAAVKVLTMITLIYLPATAVLVSLDSNSIFFSNIIAHVVSEFLFYGFCEPGAKYERGYRILKRMANRSYLRTVDVWNHGGLVALGTTSSTSATHVKEELQSSVPHCGFQDPSKVAMI
ncbi:hypothetical protein MMC22_003798 [Lobaria immixta]|nr:hypothetical protein [Lobaria immixta]